ncbi:hypothetical protein CIT292_11074 [Citrobacter youngae ATCC 29220]|uniref:Uncharacterized protein n=1 Tax=Citrobacter youngae ATCC 29220 TaxID=500640 RepID=D4BKJ4_9ENTR|nr:hypothetical protein CIT292_11074 [Citrobacter youngae ATCC 29220]
MPVKSGTFEFALDQTYLYTTCQKPYFNIDKHHTVFNFKIANKS